MRIVLDTNVLYQALRNRGGASYHILKLVRERHIDLAISVPVFLEYRDVLLRQQSLRDLDLTRREVEAVLRLIAYLATPISIHFLMRPNLRDEDDNMFVDLAFASNSHFLITNNISDFIRRAELAFDFFRVVTPAQWMVIWRREHEKED